jgi:hypothetical protein
VIRARAHISAACAAVVLLALVASATAPVAGQTPPPVQGQAVAGQRPGGPPAAAPNMTVGQVEQLFDAWEILQAKGPLKLDDSTFLTFMARFQQVQMVQRQHQGARQRLINELQNLMKPDVTTDEATLAARLKAFDDLEAQQVQEYEKALAAVDQILTVTQRARLRIFMHNMEGQKLALLAQARQQAQAIKPPNAPNAPNAPAPSAPPAPGRIIK